MSKTVVISDERYDEIETFAHLRGFKSVEQYLHEDTQINLEIEKRKKELAERRQLGREMDELRKKIESEIGVMPDSTPLLREDRER